MVEHTDSDDPVAQLAAAVLPGELGIDETWPSRFLIGLMSHRPDVKPVLGLPSRWHRPPCTRMRRSAN